MFQKRNHFWSVFLEDVFVTKAKCKFGIILNFELVFSTLRLQRVDSFLCRIFAANNVLPLPHSAVQKYGSQSNVASNT